MITPSSPRFDIGRCAQNAYIKTWRERQYLWKMALIPLFIKYLCHVVATPYMEPGKMLTLSFILLPAYLAEGWFLAHWTRTVILNHRWPFRPTGNDVEDGKIISRRARGVLSGMVGFALVNFLMVGYFSYFFSLLPPDLDPNNADPRIAIIGVVMIAASFMLFRFIWLYVPLAINIDIRKYFQAIHKATITFPMLGLWIACFIPAYFMMQFSAGLFQSAGGENPTIIVQGVDIFIRVILDMIKNLITTAAFVYAVMELLQWKKKN